MSLWCHLGVVTCHAGWLEEGEEKVGQNFLMPECFRVSFHNTWLHRRKRMRCALQAKDVAKSNNILAIFHHILEDSIFAGAGHENCKSYVSRWQSASSAAFLSFHSMVTAPESHTNSIKHADADVLSWWHWAKALFPKQLAYCRVMRMVMARDTRRGNIKSFSKRSERLNTWSA